MHDVPWPPWHFTRNSFSAVSYKLAFTAFLRWFPRGAVVKNPPANAGGTRDLGSIPGLGRSPGKGHDDPLQHFCLENSMDKGGWWATVHGVAESDMTEHACTHGHLSLQGSNHGLLQLLTFNTPGMECRVESRNEALWGKLAGQVFRQIFLGADLMSPILASPPI